MSADATAMPGSVPEPELARRRHPLLAFVVRRVLTGIATLLVASLLIFLFTNVLPGDVADAVLGKNATPDRVERLRAALHLDRPLLERYGDWLSGLPAGDLGQSAAQLAQGAKSAPVSKVIGPALGNSFVIAMATLVLLIPLSLILGTLAALRAYRPVDYGISYGSLILNALPEFVLGTFLILIFFNQLGWLPPVALVPPGASPLEHPNALVLPVLTLLGVSLAFSTRQIRAGVIESLREDSVTMARLSGLPERTVLWRYALRNALAPSIQTFAQSFQYLFGGIVVVEALFDYPGIGRLLVNGVAVRDVTLVQGLTFVIAALYIAVNIVADLVVVLLVPRLRTGLR